MVKNLLLMILLTVVCAVDYESEIQPIWDINCSGCHMYPNTYGGLDLSSYEALMQGANSGPVIIPGFHGVSSLYDRITREQSQPGNMPPAGSLADSDIELILQWIDEGALPEGETLEILGCTDPNAINCMQIVDHLYFPECSTCDNGMYDPNVVGGEAFCDWMMNVAVPQSTIEVSDGCNLDCPTENNEFLFYTASFCANCLASNTCNNMDPVILYNFNLEIFPDPLPCLLDCEFMDPVPCDNYYNAEANVDNGQCMYSDIPSYDELIITQTNLGYDIDWSAFTPPVDITQYVLQRCLDPDGDTDGDGEYEYENCNMLVPPGSLFLETAYSDSDEIIQSGGVIVKYTLYVHYPNNNYWGSAQGYYYAESEEEECVSGDINSDSVINVIDIVSLVNHILGSNALEGTGLCAADINGDGIINVIDIVSVVNLILS